MGAAQWKAITQGRIRKVQLTDTAWLCVFRLSNYPKTGCNPRKIQDLRAFSDSYLDASLASVARAPFSILRRRGGQRVVSVPFSGTDAR